jgi:hypothetical protein
MRKALEEYCDKTKCKECPLFKVIGLNDPCIPEDEKELEKNYKIIFGDKDNVNHPSHYQGKNECIEVMKAMFGVEAVKHFCMCNAYKYRFRADMKNGEEDKKKAEFYETYLINLGGVDGD